MTLASTSLAGILLFMVDFCSWVHPLYSYHLYYILHLFYIPFNTSWFWIVHFYGAFIVVHCPCWLVIKFYILLEPSQQKASKYLIR